MLHEPEFQIHLRRNILLVLEVVWNQFCNPAFRPFLQYSWRKIGYVDSDAVEFKTPVELCFTVYRSHECFGEDSCPKVPIVLLLPLESLHLTPS